MIEKTDPPIFLALPSPPLMIANCRLIFLILLSGIVITASLKSSAQGPTIKQIGLPFMANYGPADYDFSNQNFDVVVGDDGHIYFANNDGILVYNGDDWEKLVLPNSATPYFFSKSDNGTIFVGGTNEIGYLSSTKNGVLSYVSLKDKLPAEVESFVSQTHLVKDKIVFNSFERIFVYSIATDEMKTYERPTSAGLNLFQVIDDQLYIYSKDSLYLFANEQWTASRASHLDLHIAYQGHLVEFSDGQVIAVTSTGFFDFHTEVEIETTAGLRASLKDQTLYRMKLIGDRYIFIYTWNGLVIADRSGRLIKRIDKKMGLAESFVFKGDLDDSGMLWVATNNGISKIDIFSPFSVLDERLGIEGVLTDAKLQDDKLYVGGMSGIFTENWETLFDPSIHPSLKNVSNAIVHGLLATQSGLLTLNEYTPNTIYSGNTAFEIDGTEKEIFWSGAELPNSEDLILGSLTGIIVHVSKVGEKWGVKHVLDTKLSDVRLLVIDAAGAIWITSTTEGIYRLEYDPLSMQTTSAKRYGISEGLPSDRENFVSMFGSELLVATTKGIYQYNEVKDAFEPDDRFTKLVGQEKVELPIVGSDSSLFYYTDKLHMLKKESNGWKKTTFPNLDYKKYGFPGISVIDDKNVLQSTPNGLIHLDPTLLAIQGDLQVNLNSFQSLNSDSIFYGGFDVYNPDIILDADDDGVRFQFASNFANLPELNLYRWRLLGMEEQWSDWTAERSKDYTNLPHGDYTFEVVTKNAEGVESQPDTIQFTIATPWYFTIWAYLIYVVAFCLLIWGIVKMYTRKIRADRDRLEKVVEERTAEIGEQKNELLKMDDLKKRFFVNISHELRTPLTLSMGTVDQALKGTYGKLNDELYSNLQVSKRNSERLLKMVTSILDISKLEGGRIQLYATSVDPSDTVTKVLAFFSSRLEDKHISLEENLIQGSELYIDQDKFETILINLLSNAFKFTPDGGVISFTMKYMPDEIIFEIKDSGSGIPESDLNLVFDRFYQSPTIKSGEGMGVGLALTKELVELHHGTVGAKNDGGAVFTLAFPKGKDHLTANQIVDHQESATLRNLGDKYPLHDDPTITIIPEKDQDSHAEHILLVEDNVEMRKFISGILSPYYQVSWAEDGAKGLEFLKETKPDLIITDYLMPNMDGYEMALEIKKTDELAFIPIVFLTARAREQDKINVLNLGVDDYLYKPFSTDELLVRVKNLLFNKKHRAEYIEEQEIDSSEIVWKDFDSKLKQDIDRYIQENIKSEITGDDLAKIARHSERSLYRKVKANTGLSLMLYVKEYRLRQARSLLENKELPTVSEVSYAVGFNYLSHFTKSYKERFGKQPSAYLE